jgi:hypothetical protein
MESVGNNFPSWQVDRNAELISVPGEVGQLER